MNTATAVDGAGKSVDEGVVLWGWMDRVERDNGGVVAKLGEGKGR